ncbi:MAG: SAM-dependent chlorinase/fluorinase [Cytophagales bacterium]
MAMITFTSDFGLKDHYVAALKARILSDFPSAVIVDITHSIPAFDLIHGSYVLGSVYDNFPAGTVHIVALNSHKQKTMKFIAAKLNGHYFLLPNNGLLSLISEIAPDMVVELPFSNKSDVSFPEKNILSKAASQLAKGADLSSLGKAMVDYEKSLMLKPKATKSGIFGHVIYIDRFGNLITNIKRKVFEDLKKLVGPGFDLNFSKEHLHQINNHYGDVGEGDIVALFNERDLLEIAVREGNAAQLFGLRYDSPVRITFEKS